MKRAIWLLLTVLGASCHAPSEAPPPRPASTAAAEDGHLLRGAGWAPENRDRIEAFLRENGIHGSHYDPRKPPCATFDGDMTSIFNDLGDATFYRQLDVLALKLSPEALAKMIPERCVTRPVDLSAERKETLDAFAALAAAGLTGEKALAYPWEEKRRALEADPELARAHAVFRYRMIWFYEQLETVDGPPVAYPWIVKLYQGLAPAEVVALVEGVLRAELRDPEKGELCTKEMVAHPGAASWKGKAEPIEIARGIVASPEMKELYAALRQSGFDVYVVTASFRGTVAVLAARYGISSDHVVGIRLAVRPDGMLGDEVLLPITYRQGKPDNIRAFVPSEPLFAAGDSDTDVEMLTMPSVRLRLILDRKKSPTSDIGKLYERARSSDPEHYLIQGRDDYGADGTARGTWNGTTRTR